MCTTSSASRAPSESRSASLTATTTSSPSSRQAPTIRTAISPRFATSTRRSVAAGQVVQSGSTANSAITLVDGDAVVDEHPDDGSAILRLDVVHQLHHLDDAHRAAPARPGRRCRRTVARRAAAIARRSRATARPRDARPPGDHRRRDWAAGSGAVGLACRRSPGRRCDGGRCGARRALADSVPAERWIRSDPARTSISAQSERSKASTIRLITSRSLLTTMLPSASPRPCCPHAFILRLAPCG